MLDFAWGRINFLKKVADPSLSDLSISGDEEALCKIRWFFMNQGWWEKARNLNLKSVGYFYGEEHEKRLLEEENDLIHFILSKQHMIHPNVVKMVENHNNEGIRMALNQIHYGSIKMSRDLKTLRKTTIEENQKVRDGQGWKEVVNRKLGKDNRQAKELAGKLGKDNRQAKELAGIVRTSQKKKSNHVEDNNKRKLSSYIQLAELEFINANSNLVDKWILREALKGEDFYINRALY